jgi:hypothetical protein
LARQHGAEFTQDIGRGELLSGQFFVGSEQAGLSANSPCALAALVPKPRVNLTRFHGVFAPSSLHRLWVTPARRGKDSRKVATDQEDTEPSAAEIVAGFRGARGEQGTKLRSNTAGLDAKGRLFVLYARSYTPTGEISGLKRWVIAKFSDSSPFILPSIC